MNQSMIGGPELLILLLLFIFGLWWLLTFLPGKATLAASTILISFMPGPELPPAPVPTPAEEPLKEALL